MTGVTAPDEGLDTPETFAAFAVRIGKSRPYVSKLKADGRIGARCFDAEGRIIPRLALEDMAANADPARSRSAASADAADATYARHRADKTAADAALAQLTLQERRGELVPRVAIAATLGPWIRELRDSIQAAPRDTVLDPVQAAECEAAIVAALEQFTGRLASYAQESSNGGAGAPG